MEPSLCRVGRGTPPVTAEEKKQQDIIGLKWKVLYFLLAVIVQAALLIKCPLFLFRHLFPREISHFCQEFNSTLSTSHPRYIFTLVIYTMLFIGRSIEALFIEIQIYKFFFTANKKYFVYNFLQSFFSKLRSKNILLIAVLTISIYISVHSLAVASLGITLELRDSQVKGCSAYPYQVYVIYWILDIIRYGYDVAVRVLFIIATLATSYIWQQSDEEVRDEGEESSSLLISDSYESILKDREVVSADHQFRSKAYVIKGRIVGDILAIFETWFILPWILFFIATSLSVDHILQAWSKESNSEATYDFSEIVYLVYNLNQLFLLLIPYLFSLAMNQGHKKYLAQLRKNQLKRFNRSASRFAFASMQKIEKDIHFDFIPRIWGTSIKIYTDEPFFVIFLFIGIFFTVCEALI